MRKILFSLIILSICCLNSNAQYFGLPTQLNMATWTIGYHPPTSCHADTLSPFTYMARDTFVHYLQADIQNVHPGIQRNWTWNYNDGSASLQGFQGPHKNNCALVLFSGHGAEYIDQYGHFIGGNCPIFLNNTTCQYSNTVYPYLASTEQFQIGGDATKWAFFNCCLGMYDQNANDYTPMFNGVHAVFGFQSLGFGWVMKSNYPIVPCNTYSSDAYKYLWANWVIGNQDMWTAWSNALVQNYNEAYQWEQYYNQKNPGKNYWPILGYDFAVAFPFGHAYDNNGSWAYINGAQEVISNTFLYQMSPSGGTDWYPQGMCYWSTSVGTPSY